jgi:hypothetical protein
MPTGKYDYLQFVCIVPEAVWEEGVPRSYDAAVVEVPST